MKEPHGIKRHSKTVEGIHSLEDVDSKQKRAPLNFSTYPFEIEDLLRPMWHVLRK